MAKTPTKSAAASEDETVAATDTGSVAATDIGSVALLAPGTSENGSLTAGPMPSNRLDPETGGRLADGHDDNVAE